MTELWDFADDSCPLLLSRGQGLLTQERIYNATPLHDIDAYANLYYVNILMCVILVQFKYKSLDIA